MRYHSPELDQLATALSAFQGEVAAIPKDASNPFFKSTYASLPTVVAVASPLLFKHGLSVSQFISHEEDKDTLVTWVLHKSGQYIADTASLYLAKKDPQGQGSAVTYGRRYAYMSALGLVADEDDDGEVAQGRGKSQRQPKSRAKAPETSQEPSSDESGDDSGLASDDTLAAIAGAATVLWPNRTQRKSKVLAIMAETGATTKSPKELTQDQANGVLLKLQRTGEAA